ncbi:hypothetical protein VUR80DRAFT_665 [Thermomyces stellatus]
MPKHARASSSSTHRYSALPVTLTPSSTQDMYNARMTMPAYYTDVQSAPMQPQPDQQYTTYMDSAPAPTAGNEVVTAAQQMSQARTASTAWSKEDDETLLRARAQGLNWSQIQQNYFRSKTSNACRKRHERLIEHRSADSWDKANFEKLSMEYMRLRKEIWSPLAAQVGEKWTVVEQKCMSNGLKNMQSASRSGHRRLRLESGQQLQGYDDDSGISGIALTPVDGLDPSYSSPETTGSGGHSSGGVSNGSGYQMGTHPQLQALGHSGNPYGYAHPAGAHGYTPSVASAHSQSSGDAPYMTQDQQMRAQRLSSADMGIEAIIHRTPNPRGM